MKSDLLRRLAVVAPLLLTAPMFAQSAPPAAAPATQPWEQADQRLIFLTVELSSTEASLAAIKKAILQTGYQRNVKTDAADSYRLGNELMDRKGGGPVPWDQFYGSTARSFYTPELTGSYRREGNGKNVAIDLSAGNQALEHPRQLDYLYRANTEAQQRAERDAAQLGNKVEALLDRRRRLEAEQSALWCKIAFQGLEGCDLNSKPLYHFALKSNATAPNDADAQRLDAIRAAAAFVRVGNMVAELTAKGVDGNQSGAYAALQKSIAAARTDFQAAVLAQPQLARDAADPNTDVGKCLLLAKRLDELAANINDALRLAADRDAAGDEVQKNTFRGALQGSLLHYSEGVLKLDQSISTLAEPWHVVPDVTTRAPEVKLAGGSEVVPAIPDAMPMPSAPTQRAASVTTRATDDADLKASVAAAAPPANPPVPHDRKSLEQCLDDDFNALLKAEANPQAVRDVERLLAQTDQSSHWTNYIEATALIRRQRSKAVIPLLLKYMVKYAGYGNSNSVISAYSDVLNILVGQRIEIPEPQGPDRQAAMENAIIKLYVDWWQPNKQTLTTDLAKMSDDQIKFIAGELLRHSAKGIWGPGARSHMEEQRVSGEGWYYFLKNLSNQNSRPEWWKEELDGRMTAVLLDQAGYRQKPPADPHAGMAPVVIAALPLLAALRQAGEAPMLDKVAADPKQDGAARIVCILALHFVGEDITYKAPLELFDTDERLDVRLLSLLAIGLYQRDQTPVPRLVKALDDNNVEVRTAALWGLHSLSPKDALPKLIKIVGDQEPPNMVLPATMMLGETGGDEAGAALIAALEKYVKDGGDPYNAAQTLNAFAMITRQRETMVAGVPKQAFCMEQAHKAIAWWKAQHPGK